MTISIILTHFLTIKKFTHELCVISDLTYIITHKSFNIHLITVKSWRFLMSLHNQNFGH